MMEDKPPKKFNSVSMICNKQFHVEIVKHEPSEFYFYKIKDGIEVFNRNSGRSIHIPMSQSKEIAMVLLEAYCQFSPEWSNKNLDISVSIKERI